MPNVSQSLLSHGLQWRKCKLLLTRNVLKFKICDTITQLRLNTFCLKNTVIRLTERVSSYCWGEITFLLPESLKNFYFLNRSVSLNVMFVNVKNKHDIEKVIDFDIRGLPLTPETLVIYRLTNLSSDLEESYKYEMNLIWKDTKPNDWGNRSSSAIPGSSFPSAVTRYSFSQSNNGIFKTGVQA